MALRVLRRRRAKAHKDFGDRRGSAREEIFLIEVRNLVKQYGDFRAVDNVSFIIEKGKIYGFLGPNEAENHNHEHDYRISVNRLGNGFGRQARYFNGAGGGKSATSAIFRRYRRCTRI